MKFPELNIESRISRQSRIIWVVVSVLVIGVGALLATVTNSRDKKKSVVTEKPVTTLYRESKVTGLEQTAADLQMMRRRFEESLERSNTQEERIRELNQQLADLRSKLSDLESRPPDAGAFGERLQPGVAMEAPTFKVGQAGSPSAQLNTPLPLPTPLSEGVHKAPPPEVPPGLANLQNPQDAPAAPQAPAPQAQEERVQPTIRVADASGNSFDYQAFKAKSKEEYERAFTEKKEPTVFMPAGSMFAAVLLTGVDMPTSAATQQNPVPVVFRVKREAILPNFASIDVRECFLLGSGFGQMSTERAILRAEALTCVTSKGKVLETKFDAFIVGTDGKVGIPGRLVSKQGAMIARALLGGVFAGLAGQHSPSLVPQLNINPGGRQLWQDPDLNAIAKSGAATGLSTAANSISKFYLKMAEETFPVVEISAGQGVTVVVTNGTTLPLRGSTRLENINASTAGSAGASVAANAQVGGGAGQAQAEVLQPSQVNQQKQQAAQQQPVWSSAQSFGRPPQPANNPMSNIENLVRDAVGRVSGQTNNKN